MKNFEWEIVRELLAGAAGIPLTSLDHITNEQVTYSGGGYFLTLKVPSLPKTRSVLNEPDIRGRLDGIEVGYLAFIEDHEFTLECHSCGEPINAENRERVFQPAKS